MKRKIILIALISSLFMTGCGLMEDMDPGNGKVSEIVTESLPEDTNLDEIQETESGDKSENSDNSGSDGADENAEFKYFRVNANDEWYVDYSDPEDNYIMFCHKDDDNNRIAIDADDSGECSKAVYLAGENRAYLAESSYALIKNEKTDFYGLEAIHHLAVDSEGKYYEYYFFDDGKGVIYKISVLYDTGSYTETSESADSFLKNAEFFCDGPSASESEKDEITMEDIITANRLENILSKYESVQTDMPVDDEMYAIYADRECNGIFDETNAEMQKDGMMCSMESGEFLTMFTFEPEINIYEHMFFFDGMLDYFEITNISNDGGKITATAEMNEYTSKAFFESIDMECDDGAKATATITLNSDDLAIENLSVSSVSGLSNEELFTYNCSYNVQKTQSMHTLYDHMNTDEIRTITGIVDPDTEEEHTVSWKGVKGDTILFVDFHDSVLTHAYEDREFTKQYNTGTDKDKSADLTVYARSIF